MENRRPALSSVSTTLEEIVDRVAAVAEAAVAEGDEGLAHEMFEVERSLRTAHRRLESTLRRLP